MPAVSCSPHNISAIWPLQDFTCSSFFGSDLQVGQILTVGIYGHKIFFPFICSLYELYGPTAAGAVGPKYSTT